MKLARAAQIVIDLSASPRVMRWRGYQPPGGWFASFSRAIAAWNVRSELTASTGASVPFAIVTPVSSSERHAYAPLTRSGPSRACAHGMSLIWCVVCIDGMTPSFAKRGMSSGASTCACSMRKR